MHTCCQTHVAALLQLIPLRSNARSMVPPSITRYFSQSVKLRKSTRASTTASTLHEWETFWSRSFGSLFFSFASPSRSSLLAFVRAWFRWILHRCPRLSLQYCIDMINLLFIFATNPRSCITGVLCSPFGVCSSPCADFLNVLWKGPRACLRHLITFCRCLLGAKVHQKYVEGAFVMNMCHATFIES